MFMPKVVRQPTSIKIYFFKYKTILERMNKHEKRTQ